MGRELFQRPPTSTAADAEEARESGDTTVRLSQASLISAGIVIAGDVAITGCLHVDGTVHGNLRGLAGHQAILVVGESGCIDGDIDVSTLVIYGATKGDIRATDFIEIASSADIHGDINYHSARIHAGASIDGQLIYIEKAASG